MSHIVVSPAVRTGTRHGGVLTLLRIGQPAGLLSTISAYRYTLPSCDDFPIGAGDRPVQRLTGSRMGTMVR